MFHCVFRHNMRHILEAVRYEINLGRSKVTQNVSTNKNHAHTQTFINVQIRKKSLFKTVLYSSKNIKILIIICKSSLVKLIIPQQLFKNTRLTFMRNVCRFFCLWPRSHTDRLSSPPPCFEHVGHFRVPLSLLPPFTYSTVIHFNAVLKHVRQISEERRRAISAVWAGTEADC